MCCRGDWSLNGLCALEDDAGAVPKENGLGLGMVIIPITNNVILNSYVKELKQYAMDSKFEIVEDIKACGKLYGNGNGMEYMVMLSKGTTFSTK